MKKKHKRTYILTFDVREKVGVFNRFGIKTPSPNDKIFDDLESEILKYVELSFPEANVVAINTRELAEKIVSKTFKRQALLKNADIISTCSEISRMDESMDENGFVLNINRLVNEAGDVIGIGPRPGTPSISDQIINIKNKTFGSARKPLILMEDGIFSGRTLINILEKFNENNLDVEAIVVGFSFPNAIDKVKSQFDGELIVVEEFDNLIDWMPDHDFVPFIPNCGRVLGLKMGEELYPFYSKEGATYSMPYIMPFAPLNKWASISEKHQVELSRFCASWTLELFRAIDSMNENKILIGDLLDIKPKISIPINIGFRRFPRLDSYVTDYLSDLCHEY